MIAASEPLPCCLDLGFQWLNSVKNFIAELTSDFACMCCSAVVLSSVREEELLDEAVCSHNYVNLWTCMFCKNFTSLSTRKKCNCQGYVLVIIPTDTKIPMMSGEIDFSGDSSPLLPVLL